jgi:hypothetical protein
MERLGKETDLSQELPTRRSWLPARRPARSIGKHRRKVPRRARRPAQVTVTRIIDLPKLEGDPTYRADQGLVRLGAEMRPLRGQVRLEIEAPAGSSPSVAMTVLMLFGTGAALGVGGFVAADLWGFPPALSVLAVTLLFVSPLIAYLGLCRRG